MGRLPADVLSELRSPTKALADLVAKFKGADPDHPHRPMWERMIRQLEVEIDRRGTQWPGYLRNACLC